MENKDLKVSRNSRRGLIKGAIGTGALLIAQANRAPAQQTGTMAGRKFRAFVRHDRGTSVEELTLLPIQPRQVVIRTAASQCCYTITSEGLAMGKPLITGEAATILGHGGVGVVEAVGPQVRRVQVGDRVLVGVTPQCGDCYNCIHGRPDRCLMHSEPNLPIATMRDGTPVIGYKHRGGFGELIVADEIYCCTILSDAPSAELAMLHCVGMCGLGATMTVAPIEVASDVVVLGCGPVGLSAVQGARIKGASQIIAVEPIRYRREAALKVGATVALDPNAEGDKLVEKIRHLCKAGMGRKLSGGGNIGPEFVIEAVGGDAFPPKVEGGPDPAGTLPLQQAWELCSEAGHLVTTGVGRPKGAKITFSADEWANAKKNHHPGNLGGANPKRDLPRFVRLIETGQFNAKALATATYSLDRAGEALQAAADRTTVAAVIVFG
jgi:S-(hydroxymethyl)glutathione dehydrogenase/alcohol dehydrogenase